MLKIFGCMLKGRYIGPLKAVLALILEGLKNELGLNPHNSIPGAIGHNFQYDSFTPTHSLLN